MCISPFGTTSLDPIDLLLKGMNCLKRTLWVSETYQTTQVDFVHHLGQQNLLGPPKEALGPVFGDFGPFWARLGPQLGGWSTFVAGTRALRVLKVIVCRPNNIPDSVVNFFSSILGPLLL